MKTKIAIIGTVVLVVMLVTTGTSAQDQNLVINGDFEVPVVTNPALWEVFASGTAGLGWQVEWAGNFAGAPSPANVELQRLPVPGWLPYSGSQYTELDSDYHNPGGPLEVDQASIRIYQDIPTCPGGTYELQYAWSPRPGQADNVMEVWWGGQRVVTHSQSGAGNSGTVWTLETRRLTTPGSTTRLAFVETGAANSQGMFLDAVKVIKLACKVNVDIRIKIYPCCPDSTVTKASCEIECKPYISGAVLGSATFDVHQIDPATLNLGTLKVLLNEDGTPQCSIADVSDDGYDDLVCRFENAIQLTGKLNDGTLIEGSDTVCCPQ
jgi:hypothetical protein